MWADNVLGNSPQGTTVFEKRPHAATLKALMINTAEQYPFAGTVHDLTRMHQGWGLPSARRFYDRRSLLEVVGQTEPLQELDVHTWTAIVPSGQSELKVTLVYTDRAGTTSSTLHRINDVSVKVTSPDGSTTWYGNNGLEAGNWSAPGGGPDTKNTVENVFIQSPAAGPWTIEISADDLNQDQHVETPLAARHQPAVLRRAREEAVQLLLTDQLELLGHGLPPCNADASVGGPAEASSYEYRSGMGRPVVCLTLALS